MPHYPEVPVDRAMNQASLRTCRRMWTGRSLAPPDVMPYAGRRLGHEGVGEYFAAFDKCEVVKLFEPKEFFGQDNTVVVLGDYRGMVKATSNDFEFQFVHVFRLNQGLIIEFCEHADTAAAVKAFQA
jgi:ketosteroid isomerase-like protein